MIFIEIRRRLYLHMISHTADIGFFQKGQSLRYQMPPSRHFSIC
jgi:hypothetical protein